MEIASANPPSAGPLGHSTSFETFRVDVGFHLEQGCRQRMEDRVVVLSTEPAYLLMGVFDGHYGEGVSNLAANRMVPTFQSTNVDHT